MWRRVWIWERKGRNGSTYCLRWHDDRGRIRTESVGRDRKLVKQLRHKREFELNAGRLRSVTPVAYKGFVEEELEAGAGRLAPKSLADLEHTLRSFGELCEVETLLQVTLGMVEQYYSRRLREVSPATANKNLRALKAAFNRAIRRGHLDENPVKGLKPVREPEREIRVLSPEEVGRPLLACPSPPWWAWTRQWCSNSPDTPRSARRCGTIPVSCPGPYEGLRLGCRSCACFETYQNVSRGSKVWPRMDSIRRSHSGEPRATRSSSWPRSPLFSSCQRLQGQRWPFP